VLDTREYDTMDIEEQSLYHLLKTHRRYDTRAILQVQDSLGNIVTCSQDLSNIFLKHLRHKFGPIDIDGDSIHRLQDHTRPLCLTTIECLEQPITLEEVIAAIRSRAGRKTPGFDGICLEFYSANWETVHTDLLKLLNQISLHKNTTPCRNRDPNMPPEDGRRNTPNWYRRISLLNTD
jgi:hypothetical protein